jgi:CBS domain containing-hemolysin-like protein/mannitol/fructose-specific phosphotransferase system IIA component (Ntr-type)
MILLVYILVFVLLLLLNVFFSLSEYAIVKIRGSQIEEIVDNGHAGAHLIQHIHANLDEYISVCQVGITFASIALGFVGEKISADLLTPHLHGFGGQASAHAISSVIAVTLVSFVHILLGEQVPKLIVIRKVMQVSLFTARPLRWSYRVLFLPRWFLNVCSKAVLRLIGLGELPSHEQVSEDELRIILERGQSGGLMSFRRLLFMENIFDLGDLKAKDAMRPRNTVQCLRAGMTWVEVEDVMKQWRFSRFPLIEDDPEKPLRYVHVKQLLPSQSRRDEVAGLLPFSRPMLSVEETKPLEQILADMQHRRIHLAMVCKNGLWTGLITMEDIIEEIIGTVTDEFELEPPVNLADVLGASRIVLDIEALSIVDAVRQALNRVPVTGLPASADILVRAIADRERVAGTYLGRGIGMPHARLPEIAGPALFIIRSGRGIPVEGSVEKAMLLFVLVTPAGQPRVHLKLQARIAELLQESDYVEDRLLSAATPADMLEIIRTGEQASID